VEFKKKERSLHVQRTVGLTACHIRKIVTTKYLQMYISVLSVASFDPVL
jgi:hypothetical protein